MAENPGEAREAAENSGGLVGAFFGGVAKVWNALMEDGHLAAAGRQGLGELGEALRAFPDSIQVQERGTIFNPMQGEIAADRADDVSTRQPWPSEIASQDRNQPSSDRGYDQGADAGHSM